MAQQAHLRWLWLPLAVIGADQATKYAVEKLTPEEFSRAIIPGLLNLVHRHNPGVAFGLLADVESPLLRVVLLIFAVGAIGVLSWLLLTGRAVGLRSRAGLALILGGAAGNALDRLIHGSVIDFVDFHVAGNHWPAFNVADSAIVVGAGLVILDLLTERPDPRHSAPPEKAGEA